MGYFEDLYSKKGQEREEQKKIQEQEDIKRMLLRYNDDVKYINKLIKAIIEKISYEPPDTCDWISEDGNSNSEKNVVAWLIYSYNDNPANPFDTNKIFLLPNGKLTSYGANDAIYLDCINYTEGRTLIFWKERVPFYRGIVKSSVDSMFTSYSEEPSYYGYPNELLRERFIVSAKSIFGVEIDENQ